MDTTEITTATELQVQEAALPSVGGVSPQTMMEVISRAASDPTVDVNKLERLMAMAERLKAQEAKEAYANDMTTVQLMCRPISQDAANTQTKSTYATLGALDEVLRPIYTAHGFNISFTTGKAPSVDTVRVIAKVKHRGGHEERHKLDIPADGKGPQGGAVMTRTHAAMSAVTYGRRGLLKMIFNITEGDDDGNAAGGPISEDQRKILDMLLTETNTDMDKFLRSIGAETFQSIPASKFKGAKLILEGKKKLQA